MCLVYAVLVVEQETEGYSVCPHLDDSLARDVDAAYVMIINGYTTEAHNGNLTQTACQERKGPWEVIVKRRTGE